MVAATEPRLDGLRPSQIKAGLSGFVVQRPVPVGRNSTIEVPGRDGILLAGQTLGSTDAVIRYTYDGTWAERTDVLRALMAKLNKGECRLSLDGGATAYAVAMSSVETRDFITHGSADVTFSVLHPAAYGETKTATVPSGSSVTFTVGGNYPTRPTIYAASAVRNSSTLTWALRHYNTYFKVMTGTSSAVSISADCEKGTLRVSGVANSPTLDSDYFEFSPGRNTVQNSYGTGESTLTWVERWL